MAMRVVTLKSTEKLGSRSRENENENESELVKNEGPKNCPPSYSLGRYDAMS